MCVPTANVSLSWNNPGCVCVPTASALSPLAQGPNSWLMILSGSGQRPWLAFHFVASLAPSPPLGLGARCLWWNLGQRCW